MSLTEMMVVIAMMGVIFSLGAQIMIQFNRYMGLSKVRINLQRDARVIFSIINRNLRQAKVSTVTLDRVNGQPPYSRITFTRIDGQVWSFYQNGRRLMMDVTTGGNTNSRTLTEDIRYLAFTPPKSEDLSIISVSLTLEQEIFELRTKALHMASEKVMVMNK